MHILLKFEPAIFACQRMRIILIERPGPRSITKVTTIGNTGERNEVSTTDRIGIRC